ncbi:glycosyltransferase family 4 protein [Roseinatronobacter alkalisoli]|uniref:Glycosyltransferase family 4 protein n=1 Tax=Roseinatronobacter alkalisoli TaxID=3028235 RepID=A0ABT5T6Z9_9RHOB|nr:glycosyltransferase family 4 protein [Roseinatronobacter sp. HJB301]MDD7970900.1 glycosyltransferase family 4 protein [Roseinatronobacter sp. HJB301]
MPEPVTQSVSLPPDAAHAVRQSLGLGAQSALRIAFVAGPGDAVGTFDHWQKGAHDPRTPVIAYSSMFYSVADALAADVLMLVEQDRQPAAPDPRFRFIHTPRRRGRRGIGYRLDERAFTACVLRHLRDFRPDVIIVGTDAPNALIAGLPATRRVILTAHNTFWPMGRRPVSLKARLRLRAKSWALRRVDAVVNTSGECAAQVAALSGPSGTRSFTEIPQVLPDWYPETLTPAPTAERLLYLGRIEANKGVFDLLGAFDAIAADRPTLTLDIAGTGTADAPLRAAIAASPHAARITFHGQLQARDVHDRLDAADLLICPTRTDFAEGLALVVVEAAVHGVPALLSSIVPAKALLPGACVTFPADDSAALTAALRGIVDTPAEYGALCAALATKRHQFRERSGSWGSMLYRALVA